MKKALVIDDVRESANSICNLLSLLRIEGKVQPRPDADLQDAVARLDLQQVDGSHPSRIKDLIEKEIGHRGQDGVGPLDVS